MSFNVRARFGKFLDASADFDAQTQESKQGTVLLKLGEFALHVQHSDSVSFWMPRLILTQK